MPEAGKPESSPPRSALRGLGINCFAGAVVPSLLAILLIWWQYHQVRQTHRAEVLDARAQHLLDLVRVLETEERLLQELVGSSYWQGGVLLTIDADAAIAVHQEEGMVEDLPAHAGPSLIAAAEAPAAWQRDGRIWAAALHPDRGRGHLVLVQGAAPAALPAPWLATVIIAVIGGLLAWYLALRIHRPVTAIARAADAVAKGETARFHPRHTSSETQGLAISVERLASSRSILKSTDDGDSRD